MKNEKRKTLPARLKTSMFGNFSGEKCTEEDLTGEQVGYMLKRGRVFKNWKRRYFVLKGKNLSYFDKDTDPSSRLGFIDLTACSSLVLAKSRAEYIIYITIPGRVLQLKSTDEKDTKLWYTCLEKAIKERKEISTIHQESNASSDSFLLSGFLGKSKVIRSNEVTKDWSNVTNRWSNFTMRYFVLASDTKEEQTSFNIYYYTDETCKSQRGLLKIEGSVKAAFQSTKVPWKPFVDQDLKFESPMYLVLSSESQGWMVVLCPRSEDDALQWRTAIDTVIHQTKIQDGVEEKNTLACKVITNSRDRANRSTL